MAGENPSRIAYVKGLPCCACRGRPCDAHHPTFLRHTGHDARRAHDDNAIPMCHGCHMDLHSLSGSFKGWSRERLRQWQAERVAELQRRDVDGDTF